MHKKGREVYIIASQEQSAQQEKPQATGMQVEGLARVFRLQISQPLSGKTTLGYRGIT